jgi:uncharacterized protein YndB with AHSA1/START domain
MVQQKENRSAAEVKGKELMISRLLNAPLELVWKVWTDPEHIKNWWGPEGFTNTISEMSVKTGGEWNLIMHGPDGKDYKNKSVFTEVVPGKKLAFDHISHPPFKVTVTFEEKGNKTLLTWRMQFDTIEQVSNVVNVFKADQGLTQNVDKLETYLLTQQ